MPAPRTAYGTLRAFVRLDAGARTGYSGVGTSGTQQRIGQAYPGIGVDSFGRDQQFANVDKAFIQFAGLTAGRASSFFDFYAHDFEFAGATAGSDLSSTNLIAYTATMGNGLSATLSVEDPVFRRTPIYSPLGVSVAASNNGSVASFAVTNQPTPVFIAYNSRGVPTSYGSVDVIQRSRLPDLVGAVRLDQAWGSAQLSAATHELNVGNLSSVSGQGAGNIAPHQQRSRLGGPGWPEDQRPIHRTGRRPVPAGCLRRGRAALYRLLRVQRLLLAERGHDPGPEVQPVLHRRQRQPVHGSAAEVRELHGGRVLPAY